MSNIKPRPGKIYLLPIKKSVTSSSGIILEEDRWELLSDTYEVMFDILEEDFTKHGIMLKPGDKVICSDQAGINVLVENKMIKIVDEKDILGIIS